MPLTILKVHNTVLFTARRIVKRPWSDVERRAVEDQLGKFLRLRKVPGKTDCSECVRKAGTALKARTWKDVKNYVHNRTYKS